MTVFYKLLHCHRLPSQLQLLLVCSFPILAILLGNNLRINFVLAERQRLRSDWNSGPLLTSSSRFPRERTFSSCPGNSFSSWFLDDISPGSSIPALSTLIRLLAVVYNNIITKTKTTTIITDEESLWLVSSAVVGPVPGGLYFSSLQCKKTFRTKTHYSSPTQAISELSSLSWDDWKNN